MSDTTAPPPKKRGKKPAQEEPAAQSRTNGWYACRSPNYFQRLSLPGRSHVLLVCGDAVEETVKNDIATVERLRITVITLDGILTVKGQGRGDG
ncbi:hypothetical protein [Hungatella effluvii]|uniref:hypothetical protein n=1 Tax=Hungatella effluvii TaxID=1096246 RepID=UPI0022E48E23|nr:hypothetical protein [Hungatella effluvii]